MSKVLIVDLNNFARYPTLAIGYLIAPLRNAGFHVDLLSPLTIGAPPIEREKAEDWREHLKRRVNFATHPMMQKLHEPLRKAHTQWQTSPHKPTLKAVSDWLDKNEPDVILLSAYLDHYPVVKEIAHRARLQDIPVLLGGPAFSSEKTIAEWQEIEGVTAIFAGEADLSIAGLVRDAIQRKDLAVRQGVFVRNRKHNGIAPPLDDLDRLPIPDFDDFGWDDYPHRIIPVMTGRGCSWGVCTFCSDVTTSNGRSYRSRSLQSVLNELQVQSARYQSRDFIFLDLKLNSDLDVWYGLIKNFQKIVPGGRWIATVHVNGRGDNGLDYDTLRAARESGLTRISFGLETGSQKLARRMAKGTNVQRNQQFVSDAHRAGLSVRCSMMLGYPGETSEDLQLTHKFLDQHLEEFDRVRPARFKAIPGTRFETLYNNKPTRFNGIEVINWDHKFARAAYEYKPAIDKNYRKTKRDILDLVHQINRKPLRDGAIQFDGLM
ncbi:MAG: B12-binding domain-containing radical SAM protein [Thiolinea sp.]